MLLTCSVVFVVLDQVGDGAEEVLLSEVKLLRVLRLLDVIMFYDRSSFPTNKQSGGRKDVGHDV